MILLHGILVVVGVADSRQLGVGGSCGQDCDLETSVDSVSRSASFAVVADERRMLVVGFVGPLYPTAVVATLRVAAH